MKKIVYVVIVLMVPLALQVALQAAGLSLIPKENKELPMEGLSELTSDVPAPMPLPAEPALKSVHVPDAMQPEEVKIEVAEIKAPAVQELPASVVQEIPVVQEIVVAQKVAEQQSPQDIETSMRQLAQDLVDQITKKLEDRLVERFKQVAQEELKKVQ